MFQGPRGARPWTHLRPGPLGSFGPLGLRPGDLRLQTLCECEGDAQRFVLTTVKIVAYELQKVEMYDCTMFDKKRILGRPEDRFKKFRTIYVGNRLVQCLHN